LHHDRVGPGREPERDATFRRAFQQQALEGEIRDRAAVVDREQLELGAHPTSSSRAVTAA